MLRDKKMRYPEIHNCLFWTEKYRPYHITRFGVCYRGIPRAFLYEQMIWWNSRSTRCYLEASLQRAPELSWCRPFRWAYKCLRILSYPDNNNNWLWLSRGEISASGRETMTRSSAFSQVPMNSLIYLRFFLVHDRSIYSVILQILTWWSLPWLRSFWHYSLFVVFDKKRYMCWNKLLIQIFTW